MSLNVFVTILFVISTVFIFWFASKISAPPKAKLLSRKTTVKDYVKTRSDPRWLPAAGLMWLWFIFFIAWLAIIMR